MPKCYVMGKTLRSIDSNGDLNEQMLDTDTHVWTKAYLQFASKTSNIL